MSWSSIDALKSLSLEHGNFIHGEWVEATTSKKMDVLSPIDGQVIAQVPNGDPNDVNRAVNSARNAFLMWAGRTPRQRAEAMFELADRLIADIPTMKILESINSGHPISTVEGEVRSGADRLRFYGGAGRTLEGRSSGEYAAGYTSIIRREPIGVAGLITPWNYPLLTAITKLAPALAAGNTLVLKPSEQTPLTTLRLAQLAADVLPPGVLNVITGYGESVGAAMATHPGIDIISLTGGTDTGKIVARLASNTLKHVHLELGGKAPAIVLADADPQQVAAALKWASYWNAGQDCSAASRVIVSSGAYESLLSALVTEVSSLKVGDPSDPATEMGPLTHIGHRNAVLGFFDRAVDAGARVELGGSGRSGPGYFIEPTILSHVDQKSEIVQREVFGPMITLQRAKSDDEALSMANDVEYGLGASIFTQDVGKAMNATRKLTFGTVWVNDHGAVSAEMPWGGFKQSGYGKERSIYSIEEYTQIKHIMIKVPE